MARVQSICRFELTKLNLVKLIARIVRSVSLTARLVPIRRDESESELTK